MATQTETAAQLTEQMSKQMEQMFSLANMVRAQSEKAMDFWMNQTLDAFKESQKLTKEWFATGKTLTDEWFSAVQANTKEIGKIFTSSE